MAEDTYTKADLDAAIEKAVGPLKDSIGKLETKNEELIGENRKLKRGAEIKPEDLEAAEKRADTAEAKVKELESSVKTLTKERDTAVKNLETEHGFTQKLLIQDGLKSALIANGVKDEDFIDSLAAKFGSGATVKVDGDTRTAMLGDKPLADAIKEWAGTDAGKKFVAAPVNGGGGAGGSNGQGGGAKTATRAQFDAMSHADRMTFAKDGGKVVDQAA
jgi:hypothetical protein